MVSTRPAGDDLPQSMACPNCGAVAHFDWSWLFTYGENVGWNNHQPWYVGRCFSCEAISIYHRGRLVAPAAKIGPQPNPDMPSSVRKEYEEARTIASHSPRGAAALLRLGIQRLMMELGKPGKKLDNDIAALVADGLDERIQKALDTVRVIGNNAVHPGQIDLDDRPEDVTALFQLVNMVVDELISKPSRLNSLYDSLPPGALEGIENRDKRSRNQGQ